MLRISLTPLFVLLFFSLQSIGQANQAEFQLCAFGSIHNSSKASAKPLSEFGINYQPYLFPRTYLVLGLQGNTRSYNEDSSDTLNTYTGTLKYNQIMLSLGVRHYFKEEIVETFNFYGEADFHYTRLNTLAEFIGGDYGQFYRHERFKGMGLSFKAGTVYQRNSPWYYGANVALYLSGGLAGKIEDYAKTPADGVELEDLIDNGSLTRFGVEFRIGYRFFKE